MPQVPDESISIVPLVSKAVPPFRRLRRKPRERVMALLDQAERNRITFLSAPQGYGKTTALADWYARRKDQGDFVAWFTVDRNDRNPRCFWINLHNALFLSLNSQGIQPAEHYLAMSALQRIHSLANDLSLIGLKGGQLFVIVDCFDLLEGYQSMDELLTWVLALSGDVHVILSSRKQYSRSSFSGHVIPEMPLSLTGSDLAFTLEEQRIALEERLGEGRAALLSQQELAGFHQKTLGWPMATDMALRSVSESDDPRRHVVEVQGSDNTFWCFFEQEVYGRMEDDERELLLKTSSLGVLRCRTVSYVLDCSNVADMLQDLSVRNLFVCPYDAKMERYTLHPLFSEWLIARSASLNSDEFRRINAKASRWFIRHGMVVPAAKHKILSCERDDLLELVEYVEWGFSASDAMRQLTFRQVPSEDELSVSFCLMAVWAYALSADLDNMAPWEDRLREAASQSAELGLMLDVLEVKKLCLLSRFDQAMEKMERVEPTLQDRRSLPLRLVLIICRAEALDQQGRVQEAIHMHRMFSSLQGSAPNRFMGVINDYEVACSLFEQGEITEAARLCLRLSSMVPAYNPVRGAATALSAMIDVMRGVQEDQGARLDQVGTLVSRHYNVDMYLDWCVVRAWVHASQGNVKEADQILLEAMNAVRYSLDAIPRGVAVIPFESRAVLRMLQGDAAGALEAYRDYDMTGRSHTARSQLVRDMVLAETLEPDLLEERMLELHQRCGQHGYALIQVSIALRLALACFDRGQRTKACRLLHDCLGKAAAQQMAAPFSFHAERMRPLLVVYLTNAKPDYERRSFVQGLLKSSAFCRIEQDDGAERLIGLTEKEQEVLRLALAGMGRDDIAAELCVSESTVKTHLSHMYRKFGVSRFGELLSAAADLGL